MVLKRTMRRQLLKKLSTKVKERLNTTKHSTLWFHLLEL